MGAPILALLGSAGAAGGNIVSNIMTNLSNTSMNAANIEHEKEMLNMQNAFNAEQAVLADKRTRALYNDLQSPEAIKQQLQKAGLSVGLMYGQGGLGGHMQTGAQTNSAGAISVGRTATNPILDAQTAGIIANAAKTAAETEKLKSEKENVDADTQDKLKNLPLKDKQIQLMDKNIDKIQSEIEQIQEETNKIAEEKLNVIEQRGNIKEDTKLKIKQTELAASQTAYNNALAILTNIDVMSRAKMNQAQIKQIQAATAEMNASAKKLGIENEIVEKTKWSIIEKKMYETLTAKLEYGIITPLEAKKLTEELEALKANNWENDQLMKFIEKHPRLFNWGLREMVMSGGHKSNVGLPKSKQ